MSKIVLCDPVGEASGSAKKSLALRWSPDGRIATLFNNHVSSHRVWKRVESLLAERLPKASVSTFDKENTFAQAPAEVIDNVVARADVALVGVGA